MRISKGYTLIELIVAVGLFAIVMLLASSAYITLIGINNQVQGLASGIDNLSFALETMARGIRTGTQYSCLGGSSDCVINGGTFSFVNEKGKTVLYSLAGTTIQKTVDGTISPLTDSSVDISSLVFYVHGANPTSSGDYQQSRVTIVVSGTVDYGKGKTESFTVETGATMRVLDI